MPRFDWRESKFEVRLQLWRIDTINKLQMENEQDGNDDTMVGVAASEVTVGQNMTVVNALVKMYKRPYIRKDPKGDMIKYAPT